MFKNIQIILIFLTIILAFDLIFGFDPKSDHQFRQNFDKKKNFVLNSVKRVKQMDDSFVMNNRLNISVSSDWKSSEVEIHDQKNGSFDVKNVLNKDFMIRRDFVERLQIHEKRSFGRNERSERLIKPKGMDDGLKAFSLNKTAAKPQVLIQLLQRFKRRAQNQRRRYNQKYGTKKPDKKDDKNGKRYMIKVILKNLIQLITESSISDAFLDIASKTLKDGLRGGVKLWNKLKTQINDGFSSRFTKDKSYDD